MNCLKMSFLAVSTSQTPLFGAHQEYNMKKTVYKANYLHYYREFKSYKVGIVKIDYSFLLDDNCSTNSLSTKAMGNVMLPTD